LPDESGTSIGITTKWKGEEDYDEGGGGEEAFSDIDQYDDLN
jgi:hypothetical protein